MLPVVTLTQAKCKTSEKTTNCFQNFGVLKTGSAKQEVDLSEKLTETALSYGSEF